MSDEWVEIRGDALPVAEAIAFTSTPAAGGIDVFLGTTRGETNSDGRELIALDYEAYAAMADQQFRSFAKQARQRWPIVRLVILHRTGRVGLGEPSVLIAVSTPHRAESFEACHWLIDTLKKEATIWKKQVWQDGAGEWVHP
ncbi:MAG TPA: molybdenum cofactor biosynthesis protein MoaE [Tepidisphaeraceae bacterium]|nr:molybdenum cofactor biosynthesis protein MoaE [Tepidisphaeraceae bacterium]